MPIDADFLIRNVSELVTCAGPAPRRGAAQGDAGSIPQGAVASRDGRIVFVGPESACRDAVSLAPEARVLDARGGAVIPGFVDAHTHLVYAGDRRAELRRRLTGESYAAIAAGGGGIVSTVGATRDAHEADLLAAARGRLAEALRQGVTTCEVKGGYGLTTASELKLLRVARALDAAQPIDIVTTFLGAHEVPPEHRARRDDYIRLVVEEMIPAVAEAGLADWCDVFCEEGVFTPDESRAILLAGQAQGLPSRIHANELGSSGGARVAAEVGARSADHLVYLTDEEVEVLAAAGVAATLLPAAAFYLKLGRYAPARRLIDAGVPVALATDVNPGGGLSPSMPFAITLGCFAMDLTLEEALVAATINAAWSLDRHDRAGSLEPGKPLDAVVLRGPATELLRVGADAIRAVVKHSRVVSGAETPGDLP